MVAAVAVVSVVVEAVAFAAAEAADSAVAGFTAVDSGAVARRFMAGHC